MSLRKKLQLQLSHNGKGFTLIEVVLVILLLGILAAMTASYMREFGDAEKWETTRAKMEAIKTAILGDPEIDSFGERTRFGYIGDMGRLPGSLTVLTASESPAYIFTAYYGVGSGWRGPYISQEFSGEYPIEQDEWGNAFSYSTTANPPSLISYGADGASGGSVFDQDITLEFPASSRLSTVHGTIRSGENTLSDEVVQIQYPVNGTLTEALNTSDAKGFFSFSGVPFGARALMVTSVSPVIGPVVLVVDEPQEVLGPDVLDQRQKSGVKYNDDVVLTVSNKKVTLTLTSTYTSDRILDYIVIRWTATGSKLEYIELDGDQQTFADIPSNERIDVYQTLTIPANSTDTEFVMYFDGNVNNNTFTITFEWTSGEADSIMFGT